MKSSHFPDLNTVIGRVMVPKNPDKEKEGKKPLFNYKDKRTKKGNQVHVTRTFHHLDGQPALVDQLTLDGNVFKKNHRTQFQIKEETWVERKGKKLTFIKTQHGKTEKAEEDWRENTFIPAQIPDLIRENWDKLHAGEEFEGRIIIPSRLDTVGVDIEKSEDVQLHQRKTIVFELTPSSFFIRLFVASVYLYVDHETRQMVLYRGRLPVKQWKDDEFTDWIAEMELETQPKATAKKAAQPT